MKGTPSEIQKALTGLGETPRRLARTLSLPPVKLSFRPDKKSWSASDILAHLRACADLWTHSIYAALAESNPTVPDINERKWARVARYAELPFAESFEAFRLQRENLLRVLRDLPPESWERGATILGRRHTVFTQSRRMAKHEAEHVQQVEDLLNL